MISIISIIKILKSKLTNLLSENDTFDHDLNDPDLRIEASISLTKKEYDELINLLEEAKSLSCKIKFKD